MRKYPLTLLVSTLALGSCQPVQDQAPTHQPVVLDYTMLGIWPERFQVIEVANALEEAGIRSTLSGFRPSILNVETAKLSQAQDIVASNPKWQQTRIR